LGLRIRHEYGHVLLRGSLPLLRGMDGQRKLRRQEQEAESKEGMPRSTAEWERIHKALVRRGEFDADGFATRSPDDVALHMSVLTKVARAQARGYLYPECVACGLVVVTLRTPEERDRLHPRHPLRLDAVMPPEERRRRAYARAYVRKVATGRRPLG